MKPSGLLSSVRARLVGADPQLCRKERSPQSLALLGAIARASFPHRPAALQQHVLFEDHAEPPPHERLARALSALEGVPLPEKLVGLWELHRELGGGRRAASAYYTPSWLAAEIVARALRGDEANVLDLSCGAGAFLVAALRRKLRGTADFASRAALARSYVWGTDTDEQAVHLCRGVLGLLVCEGTAARSADEDLPFPELRFADPLAERTFACVDAVVGNPPFLDAKSRVRASPALGAALRLRFPDLAGSFDLFAAFVLRALEVTKPGAPIGLIVPDKILPAAYASGVRRRLLAETTLLEIADLEAARPFPEAAVFPLFLLFEKVVAPEDHVVRLSRFDEARVLTVTGSVRQRDLEPGCFVLGRPARSPRTLVELRSLAEVSVGTAGFDAHRMRDALVDGDPGEGIPFVVSRNIDRYALRGGPVRFLKRSYAAPFLPPGAPLSPGKERLFREPKIVFAGVGKRLEATFVQAPLAVGVATYTARFREHALAYLCIVNSRWASDEFLARRGGGRLSGGYFTISARELARLPLPVLSSREIDDFSRLARLRLEATGAAAEACDALIEERVRVVLQTALPTDPPGAA